MPHNDIVSRIILATLGFVLACISAPLTRAQSPAATTITIRIVSESPARAVIEGNCPPSSIWSFRQGYGAVTELGNRIGNLALKDATGQNISVRRLAPGEYEAASRASRFSYEVDLSPPGRPGDAVFVSWLNIDRGLLMLGDLLPAFFIQDHPSLSVRFVLPVGWSVESAEWRQPSALELGVSDIAHSVFAVGQRLRAKSVDVKTAGSPRLKLITTGDWAFGDDDAIDLAAQIVAAHAQVLGGPPPRASTLILMPFPEAVGAEKWSAETRGSTVTLLMGKQPAKTAALLQLSTPLTHELFHLWVPNSLALDGEYGWFYEGFTNYQAARTAVRLRLLTFDEFLKSIARAYDTYSASAERDQWSLVEASQRRWTSGRPVVYQKAMLVAFLYDLAVRSESHGKRSLDDVYREMFRRYQVSTKPVTGLLPEGNQAAIGILSSQSGLREFVARFIEQATAISLESEFVRFGLRVERVGLRSYVVVNDSLSRSQRDLLRELGYNDEPRSFRRSSKRDN